jgi:hypothetical protein
MLQNNIRKFKIGCGAWIPACRQAGEPRLHLFKVFNEFLSKAKAHLQLFLELNRFFFTIKRQIAQ